MGNLIFGTTTIQGRTFDDIKIQTSKAGVPRPIVFGTARPIVGNIIATTAPRIEKVKEDQSGKGGPSVEVENEEVFRTYAIRICEGPVTAVRRVWRNNELVWVSDPEEYAELTYGGSLDEAAIQIIVDTIQGNGEAFGAKSEFFLGGYDQMPSAVMQSAFGMENVHGYRGTCYMVVDDDNLTATGGAIPQYAFEVERCEGFVLSSTPYALEMSDGLSSTIGSIEGRKIPDISYGGSPEGLISGISEITGNLSDLLLLYDNYTPEALSSGVTQVEGELNSLLVDYDNYNPEGLESSITDVQGSINQILIAYENYPEEGLISSITLVEGDLI